ncbi:MAG: hypothetical protein LBD42_04640 [Desulfovibrio sp.]|jgi:hypothetical protein|nr:hypothetical protein [Desulfovibrio sp.]
MENKDIGEIFSRLRKIENDVINLSNETVKIRAMLQERCSTRGDLLSGHEDRIRLLEEDRHKRKGGIAVLACLLAAAASAGAALVRFRGN